MVSPVLPISVEKVLLGKQKTNPIESFGDQLTRAIDKLNNSQLKADETAQKFLAGEVRDLHQVVLAMEEARLTMQLAVEMRNKVVEAYQEISRMQI